MRRVRHMIDVAKYTTVVFTDYATSISIPKQTTLANNNIDKLNFRLVRASIYFFQFRFNIKYRPGKKHVIRDAFSRLSSGNGPVTLTLSNNFLDLDIYFNGILNPSKNPDCYIFQGSLIVISDDFRKQVVDGYIQKNIRNKLINMLKILTERIQRE